MNDSPNPANAQGVFAHAAIEIDAPIELVWDVMQDIDVYSHWNPFVTKIDRISGGTGVGDLLQLHIKWADGSGTTSKELVTERIPPTEQPNGMKKAEWTYRLQDQLNQLALVRCAREQTLTELPNNRTLYSSTERFHGLLANFVPITKVQDGFQRHAEALETRCGVIRKARELVEMLEDRSTQRISEVTADSLSHEMEEQIPPAEAPEPNQMTAAIPSNFPDVPVSRQTFENWARDNKIQNVLTCTPRNIEDVLKAVNWAAENGYENVRARGMMHNWSPLTLSAADDASKVLLIDTTQHLTNVISVEKPPELEGGGIITVQTGILMEALLTALQREGLGLIATPAPGDLTVGGALAIAGHGTATLPPNTEGPAKGHTYGSLSNSILSLKAIVKDEKTGKYVEKEFHRRDPECQAFLAHLGRAFITEVKLQAGPNQRLRCVSEIVPIDDLLTPSNVEGASAEPTIGKSSIDGQPVQGVEVIAWSKNNAWVKYWVNAPIKPETSREVFEPYGYPFSDRMPSAIYDLTPKLLSGRLTPAFNMLCENIASVGLRTTGSSDLWGWSKDLLLYIKQNTLRVTANGYAVLTKRADAQRVAKEFVDQFYKMLDEYAKRGEYPINGPLEIRVTGLDHASEACSPNAREPQLSPLRPRPDHPEWDSAVYVDILTVPGTKHSNKFLKELEQWIFTNYTGTYATVRPEWSKGFAYTDEGPWRNRKILETVIPQIFCEGQPKNDNFYTASKTLRKYDPDKLFSCSFLNQVIVPEFARAQLLDSPNFQGMPAHAAPSRGLTVEEPTVEPESAGSKQKGKMPSRPTSEQIWGNLGEENRNQVLQALSARGMKVTQNHQPQAAEAYHNMSIEGYLHLGDSADGQQAFIAHPAGIKSGRFTVVGPELKKLLPRPNKSGKYTGRLTPGADLQPSMSRSRNRGDT